MQSLCLLLLQETLKVPESNICEHQLPVISGLLAKTASLTQGDYI